MQAAPFTRVSGDSVAVKSNTLPAFFGKKVLDGGQPFWFLCPIASQFPIFRWFQAAVQLTGSSVGTCVGSIIPARLCGARSTALGILGVSYLQVNGMKIHRLTPSRPLPRPQDRLRERVLRKGPHLLSRGLEDSSHSKPPLGSLWPEK